MGETDEEARQRLLDELAEAMRQRGVSPHGMLALAGFAAFIGSVRVLREATEGVIKWGFRITVTFAFLVAVLEPLRELLRRLLSME